ncbi:MAG: hypothetical protein A2Y94_01615 [Caldithrix sp. RBG_13_44_9]|nr:MAG: hypothetical protein A2Y94_01615 [Caldithrix sp. RBG_13_44_9]
MLTTTLLDYIPIWGIFVATIVIIILAEECGYRLGQLRSRQEGKESDSRLGGMVGELNWVYRHFCWPLPSAWQPHDLMHGGRSCWMKQTRSGPPTCGQQCSRSHSAQRCVVC